MRTRGGALLTTRPIANRISNGRPPCLLPVPGWTARGKGGSDFAYRLRISRPQPDSNLRVVPSSINGRAGATVPVTVYACAATVLPAISHFN